jgi:fermentation-respiration switch protein FrsA (DUF1100 family)
MQQGGRAAHGWGLMLDFSCAYSAPTGGDEAGTPSRTFDSDAAAAEPAGHWTTEQFAWDPVTMVRRGARRRARAPRRWRAR